MTAMLATSSMLMKSDVLHDQVLHFASVARGLAAELIETAFVTPEALTAAIAFAADGLSDDIAPEVASELLVNRALLADERLGAVHAEIVLAAAEVVLEAHRAWALTQDALDRGDLCQFVHLDGSPARWPAD
jgi:hypothetical protein